MKQRFSSLDVKVIAHELQETLTSLRVSNIYDLSSKILLFKFAKPDNKKQLVIETGFRCHLTEFGRTTTGAPSPFVARLRRFLKTRRVTSVSQIGTDRIIEFQFSDGQYRLFFEFFASGNIVLTDESLKILAISRNVAESGDQEAQRLGVPYSLENRQNYRGIPPMTKERVRNALQKGIDKASESAASAKKGKVKAGGDLRKSLGVAITEVPPVLVDHTLQANNFDLTKSLPEILESETLLDDLLKSLVEARQTVENITSSGPCKGYIFAKYRKAPSQVADDDQNDEEKERSKRDNLLYDDFHPFLPQKLARNDEVAVLEFQGYNKTVDEFFSSLEGQKLESRLTEREATARRKLESVRREQRQRIEGLQEVQAANLRKAAAIEANAQRVQEAMDAVNGLLAQGMDWVDIGKLVEREKKRHNPVAEIIKTPLRLEENIITLILSEEDLAEEQEDDPYETDEGSDDEEGGDAHGDAKAKATANANALAVEINLGLTPWGNAREYYGERKMAAIKQEKTQLAASMALKNSEQKIAADLKKGLKQEKDLLQPIRRLMWFEKFFWFISSDGYLVIGAKDGTQSEIMYKRHLRKGDVYCHADLSGASVVVIKNNPKTPDAPIPPATLSQAGSLVVCTSEAWDSKAGMGVWWVNAEQVSKSAATKGDYLPLGVFNIGGEKNFLPPNPLIIGLGFMFRISDESKARHLKHRVNDDDGDDGTAVESAKRPTQDELQAAEQLLDSVADDASAVGDESAPESLNGDVRENPLQGGGDKADAEDEESDGDVAAASNGVSDILLGDKNISKATRATTEKDETKEAASQGSDDDSEDGADVTESVAAPSEAPSKGTRSTKTNNDTAKGPPKRGKRSKAKKIAAKYKDQDEEDRAAAEALIGAKAGRLKAEAEAKAKAEREAELEAAKERRRAQHEKRQKQTAEHEEVRRRAMLEAGAGGDGDAAAAAADDEAHRTTSLDELVGTPMPGDEILEVLAVCAPWNAMGKFKYKVKMQPGSTKKGKAVKEILERIKIDSGKRAVVDETSRNKDKMWPREVELIKALKPEDVVNSVPVGKVRIMLTGGTSGGGGGKGKGGGGGGKGRGKGKK
ncbi:protein of unknown function (DUF3441) [Geosmithia morbida]|uniref:Ribosome quality control complex subunit 2 n=1 Tax=Geosmithia morbida TaxID=1094350 RepID=A0A9P4YX56_9HYPO|nr:protein of unknown function (DUF3441) [Geosmithia morbida]KAF4124718.1 protein of unknown function (DUF3441) [Geosmithia morbida]